MEDISSGSLNRMKFELWIENPVDLLAEVVVSFPDFARLNIHSMVLAFELYLTFVVKFGD